MSAPNVYFTFARASALFNMWIGSVSEVRISDDKEVIEGRVHFLFGRHSVRFLIDDWKTPEDECRISVGRGRLRTCRLQIQKSRVLSGLLAALAGYCSGSESPVTSAAMAKDDFLL